MHSRFVITVDGMARKFSLRNTVLNVGNGLALLGMTTIIGEITLFVRNHLASNINIICPFSIGEFFLLHFAKEKKNVAEKKYDYVSKRRGRRGAITSSSLGHNSGLQEENLKTPREQISEEEEP